MKKIVLINQRYGMKVNGGSEFYTRIIAEHLNKHFELEVWTTTAKDYDTWRNFYPGGVQVERGIKIRRFLVKRKRNMLRFRIVSKATMVFSNFRVHIDKFWVEEQGPYVPQLIKYIKNHKHEYDVFIFVTYLYYTTVMGLPEVADKSILIPTAHDEPYINFPIYQKVFTATKYILFLTEEEKSLVCKKFNKKFPNEVIGVGIDVPEMLLDITYRNEATRDFRKKYGLEKNYIIYAGRIDLGKKCDEMFSYFIKYKYLYPENEVQLVIIGKDMMGVPTHPDILYLGFLSEEEKYVAIAGAKYLWLPSQFESLSIALLEGMALGVPGIVNGNCSVLKGHCEKSKGALYYLNEENFILCMQKIRNHEINYSNLSKNAIEYVKENYQWKQVENRLIELIEKVN